MMDTLAARWRQMEDLDSLKAVRLDENGWPSAETVYTGYPHLVMPVVDPWDGVRYALLQHAVHMDQLAIANPDDTRLKNFAFEAASLLVDYDTKHDTGVGPADPEDIGEFEADDILGYLRQQYHQWHSALLD